MADDIVYRLLNDYETDENELMNLAADEIKRLRAALAYACGVLSTYYDETTHPEEMMHRFLEEARRG